MNPDRMAKILKRSESRKQRALARERRRLRRAGLPVPEQTVSAVPVQNPNAQKDQPSTRLIPKSTSGCGSCRKKAERLKKEIETAKYHPEALGPMPDFSGKEPLLTLK
jgi:hypothetical protein